MFTTREFWAHIDQINPYGSIAGLVQASGIDYHRLTQQRSRGFMPKPEDLLKLADATKHSIEFLLTGAERHSFYAKRIERIADYCTYRASDEDLFVIERILKIPSDYEVVEKKEKPAGKQTTSGIA